MKFQPRPNKKFKQGSIKPEDCKKYLGKKPIIYRSSWELKFIQRIAIQYEVFYKLFR